MLIIYYQAFISVSTIIIILQLNKKKIVEHIKMINLTTHELRLIAGRRDIKNYKNMSREKLLSTLDELERNFKNILQIWT